MYCHRDIVAYHYYKGAKADLNSVVPMDSPDRWYARYAVLRVLFSDTVFQKIWLPQLTARYSSAVMLDAMNEPGLLAERDAWLPKRKHTEQEFFDKFLPQWKVQL
jgi:hypothetical protein